MREESKETYVSHCSTAMSCDISTTMSHKWDPLSRCQNPILKYIDGKINDFRNKVLKY